MKTSFQDEVRIAKRCRGRFKTGRNFPLIKLTELNCSCEQTFYEILRDAVLNYIKKFVNNMDV